MASMRGSRVASISKTPGRVYPANAASFSSSFARLFCAVTFGSSLASMAASIAFANCARSGLRSILANGFVVSAPAVCARRALILASIHFSAVAGLIVAVAASSVFKNAGPPSSASSAARTASGMSRIAANRSFISFSRSVTPFSMCSLTSVLKSAFFFSASSPPLRMSFTVRWRSNAVR